MSGSVSPLGEGEGPEPYYRDESVTLYHGDCLEIMAAMAPGSIGAVLIDPPYSSGGRRENARSVRKSMLRSDRYTDESWIHGDAMSTQGFVWFMRQCGLQWRRILIRGGHALAFIDWRMAANLAAALESADLRQHPILVWDKQAFGMGAIFRNQHEFIVHMSAGNPVDPQRRDVGNVLRFPAVHESQRVHPTEKPLPLLQTLLSVVATPGLPVLDPCAGAGSSLVAARNLGLPVIGIDSDERWCEQAARKLQQGALEPATASQAPHEPLSLLDLGETA
jgi:site-specific DNA-methyltransferase (adenine-specific)